MTHIFLYVSNEANIELLHSQGKRTNRDRSVILEVMIFKSSLPSVRTLSAEPQ